MPTKGPKTKAQKFAAFDKRNPFIYRQFKMFAQQLIKQGVAELSGDFIMHRVRWENVNTATQQHNVRVNNDHVAYYVRKLAKERPALGARFKTRKLHGV